MSKDSKQSSFQTIMDSVKNLPCRKSDRQLKFRVLDSGVKENTICSMYGKKEPDQEGDDLERWFHESCLANVDIRGVGQKVQFIYCQSKYNLTYIIYNRAIGTFT